MIRVHNMLALLGSAIATVGILALTGCNATPTATTPSDSPVKTQMDKIDAMKEQVTGAVAGFKGLNDVVASTKTAVAAGDFTKAQAEFGKFEGFWATVEDGVKAKSPQTYDAMETAMGNVESSLKASDKTKAMDALKALGDAVLTAGKP
jgi:hypothetical protein